MSTQGGPDPTGKEHIGKEEDTSKQTTDPSSSDQQPHRPLSVENQPVHEGPYSGPKHDPRDKDCGFVILDNFERFNKNNDIYNRGRWDRRIQSDKVLNWFRAMYRPDVVARDVDGYTAKDFALKLAGWVGTNLMIERNLKNNRVDGYQDDIEVYFPPAKEKFEVSSPENMAKEIKRVSRMFGAALVGVAPTDPRWHYTHTYDPWNNTEKPVDLPEELCNTIVVATTMDHEILSTYPSATAGVAVGFGYSQDVNTLQAIATFIHAMGYRAVASMNDTGQKIPYAIQAGLGEYGRHTLLITKEFGPRVRLGQIYTDLPLAHDKPTRFGVAEFCNVCRLCSDACPPRAIPDGEPQAYAINQSNFVGIRKWSVDAEKCFDFWCNQGTDCGICMRVCPYNKDTSTWWRQIYYRFWVWLASTRLRRVALWLDVQLGFGSRQDPQAWWAGGEV